MFSFNFSFLRKSAQATRAAFGSTIKRKFAGGGPSGDGFYANMMRKHPFTTSAVTAAGLWGSGDLIAQYLENENKANFKVDMGRLSGTLVHGSIISGCGGYLWYGFLDKFITTGLKLIPGSFAFVMGKLAMEFIVFHPVSLFCYWMIVGKCEGHSNEKITNELKSDFLPTWLCDGALWAPLDILLFWKVPLQMQVVVVNCGSLVEAVLLSYIHKNGLGTDGEDKIGEKKSSVADLHSVFVDQLKKQLHLDASPEDVKSRAAREFDKLDVDKNGSLSIEELSKCKLLPGINDKEVNRKVVKILLKNVESRRGPSANNKIYKDEYLRLIAKLHETGYRRSYIADVVIAMFDKNGDGLIDKSELEQIAKVYLKREDVTQATLEDLMNKFDKDNDGKLKADDIKEVLFSYYEKKS
jgi:Ca2+-binding EF-hand superfamily protein